MPVFIASPLEFSNVSISLSNGNLIVLTGNQNCRICVSSYDDCGESYYQVTDSVGYYGYHVGNTTCSVCITKPGYIPYYAVIGNDVYIQNETYDADAIIKAENITAGHSVTASKPEGPVTIRQGKTKMQTTNSVTLDSGFEVAEGAELEITTGN